MKNRISVIFVGCAVGAVVWLILKFALGYIDPEFLGRVVNSSINGITFALFGGAVAILLYRYMGVAWREANGVSRISSGDGELGSILPASEDERIIEQDVPSYQQRIEKLPENDRGLLVVRLLTTGFKRARAQFSASDVSDAISNDTEMAQQQVENQYSLVRYFIWAIPSAGFLGTVMGVGEAMRFMSSNAEIPDDVDKALQPLDLAVASLHTAFDTTLVALVLSLVIMLMFHLIQQYEDNVVLTASDWSTQQLTLRMRTLDRDKP